MSQTEVRPMRPDDYAAVAEFWDRNYKLSKRDTAERIAALLEHSPELSQVAIREGAVVGTALGSYDGRKAYVYKVAVDETLRGEGTGRMLMEHLLEAFDKAGALDVRVNCDPELVPFYERFGFESAGVVPMKINRYK